MDWSAILRNVLPLLLLLASIYTGRTQLAWQTNDHVLFYGNSMIERLLEHGEMEALVQLALPGKDLHFRSLAWTGDEVGHRLRAEGYADQDRKSVV